jgi:hypothetical protein
MRGCEQWRFALSTPDNEHARERKLADELAAENRRLRKIATDLMLEIEAKREAAALDEHRPHAA